MRRLWIVVAVGVACACGDAFSPGHSRAALNLVPTFSENVYELLTGDLDQLHIRITHIPGAAIILDTTVAVDTAGNVDLDLAVTLSAETDSFTVLLEGIRSSDNTVLYSGFDTVVVKAGTVTPPGDTIAVSYVGPCAAAAGCTITVAPQDTTLTQGDSLLMRVTVDSSGQTIAGVPVSVTNLSTGLVAVSPTRHVRALTGSPGGLAHVVALIHGAVDTLRVNIAAPGSPAIGLNPTSITFTTTAGASDPASQTVSVTNAGVGSLTGLSVSITYNSGTPGWLGVGLSTTTAPSTLTLTTTQGTLPAGTYTATVTVSSSLSGVAPQPISVTLQINPGPVITASPTTVTFTTTAGGSDPAPQTVNVTNTGGGTLSGLASTVSYVSGTPGWLAAGLAPTQAPAVLTLTPTLGSLPAGTYTARAILTSTVSGVAPDTVGVTLQVNPGPAIGLASHATTFSATAAGADPTPQTVNITNAGGGTLSGLSTSTTYTSGSGWLGVSLSTTTAPSVLTLTPVTGALTPGTYHAKVTVSSSLSGVASDTVGVTFTVSVGAPALVIVTPGYAALRLTSPGNTAQLADTVKDGQGNLLSPSAATWTSRSPGVATVSPTTGLVTATGRGIATIVASAGTGADSILVAVGDTTNHGDMLIFALTNGRAFGQRKVGQTAQVDFVASHAAVPADSLASYTIHYVWNQTVLRFDSVKAGTFTGAPTVNTDSTGNGVLIFADINVNGVGGAPVLLHAYFTALTTGTDAHSVQVTELSGSAPNYVNFYQLVQYLAVSGIAAISP